VVALGVSRRSARLGSVSYASLGGQVSEAVPPPRTLGKKERTMPPIPSSIESHASLIPPPAVSPHARLQLCKVTALLAFCLVSATLLLAFFWWGLLDSPRRTLTEAELLRIKEGMTRDEVLTLLGPSEPPAKFDLAYGVLGEVKRLAWSCPTLTIRVSFNTRGTVIYVHRTFRGNRVTPANVDRVR
jgi:hypothetical protein